MWVFAILALVGINTDTNTDSSFLSLPQYISSFLFEISPATAIYCD